MFYNPNLHILLQPETTYVYDVCFMYTWDRRYHDIDEIVGLLCCVLV